MSTTLDPLLLGMYSGRRVYPLSLRPEDVFIEDIAHALSMQCRFGGHSKRFYSVAEHSVNVCKHVPEEVALEALLHDGSEAYLVDLPRPIKAAPGFEMYRYYEEIDMDAIHTRFGIKSTPESRAAIKEADNRMLATEMRDLTNWDENSGAWPAEAYPTTSILGMGPVTAKKYFLAHFKNIVEG